MTEDPDSAIVPAGEGYDQLLADVRTIISDGQQRAAAAINEALVATYWAVGERIVREEQQGEQRAAYGEQLLARLGRQLSREYGTGFTERRLREMRQFYLTYPNRRALRAELNWTHYRTLLRLPDPAQREFYGRLTATGRWSSRELDRQIQSMLYERAAHSRKPEQLAAGLPSAQTGALTYDTAFKDPYILDFLGLVDTYSEKDMEAALVRNMERFLLELGTGFAFVARQRRMTVDDKDYTVDLVFYHRVLHCLVLVDLKIGAFELADAAQMQLYLEWTKRYDKQEGEADPIGLILCGSKGNQVIELLLSGPGNRIKVAQYLLLDSEETLKQRLAQLAAAYEDLRNDTAGALETEPAPADTATSKPPDS